MRRSGRPVAAAQPHSPSSRTQLDDSESQQLYGAIRSRSDASSEEDKEASRVQRMSTTEAASAGQAVAASLASSASEAIFVVTFVELALQARPSFLIV